MGQLHRLLPATLESYRQRLACLEGMLAALDEIHDETEDGCDVDGVPAAVSADISRLRRHTHAAGANVRMAADSARSALRGLERVAARQLADDAKDGGRP